MAVQKLMRGSPSETLELLQFLHKYLKSTHTSDASRASGHISWALQKRSHCQRTILVNDGYGASKVEQTVFLCPTGCIRISISMASQKAHTQIFFAEWWASRCYLGSKHEYDHSYDGYIEAGRRSRASRTPGPSGSYTSRSSRTRPHTRTASVDSRNYATELTAVDASCLAHFVSLCRMIGYAGDARIETDDARFDRVVYFASSLEDCHAK